MGPNKAIVKKLLVVFAPSKTKRHAVLIISSAFETVPLPEILVGSARDCHERASGIYALPEVFIAPHVIAP